MCHSCGGLPHAHSHADAHAHSLPNPDLEAQSCRVTYDVTSEPLHLTVEQYVRRCYHCGIIAGRDSRGDSFHRRHLHAIGIPAPDE